jgi:flavin-dependent dehydrogenase
VPETLPALYDVLIVGGGPAGSTCARVLTAGGARVAILDRAEFPRVKLCGGWLSPGFWDAVGIAPSAYPRGLWEWHNCHVHYRGKDHAIPCHGWFIRRYELDDFLLHSSGATLHLDTPVKQIDRGPDGVWSIGPYRARYLIGAGGTHCPVARLLAPIRPRRAVGAQELELQLDAISVARTRLGKDGEPELVLFDDIGGYGWNVPKSDWLNVGVGTLDATEARGAWRSTHAHLRAAGHLPPAAEPAFEHMKGHSYFLFDPVHLDSAYRDQAFLVGDSLGLAHPITAEGILPATLSGRIAAEAILAGDPASYPARLRAHPVLADYRRVHGGLATFQRIRDRLRRRADASATPGNGDSGADGAHGHPADAPAANGSPIAAAGAAGSSIGTAMVARGFAWMFSGAKLPAPRVLDGLLGFLTGLPLGNGD